MLSTVLVVAAAVSAHAVKLTPTAKPSLFDTAFSADHPPPNMDTMDVIPAGFVYENFYSGKDCNGPIVAVTGHPTDLCLLTYQDIDNGTPTGSVRYSCNAGTMYSESFTDLECTQSLPTVQNQLMCENEVGHYGSRMGRCNSDPSVLPLPTSANYTTEILYASRDTCATNIDQFSSYLSGQCIKTSATTSVKYTQYEQSTYTASTTCTGAVNTVTLNQDCDAITTYPVESQLDLANKWAFGPVETGMTWDDGYVYVNLYAEHDCEGPILGVTGYPTNQCLKIYANASSSEPTASQMFTCNSESEFNFLYLDTECTVPDTNSTRALACNNIIGRFSSGQGMCNVDPARLPLPDATFVTQVLYDTPGSCDMIASFESFVNDYCYHNGNNGFSYEYPTLEFYQNNPACDGAPSSTQALPAGCQPVAEFPADTMVAAQWFFGYVPYIPSDAPTAAPTAMPTPESYSAGFLYANFYADHGCSGEVIAVAGRPTDTCLVAYEDATTAEPTGSYKFSCSGDMSMTTRFSDTNCQTPLGNTTNTLNCRSIVGRFGSVGGGCNSDTSRLPLPAANFTTEIQYDSPSACGGKIVEFESYQNGHCFNNGGPTSLKYEFPKAFYYNEPTCTTESSNTTLWTDCKTITEYPVTDGVTLATKWFYGNINFGGGSSSDDLSTAEIAGIAAGGAVFLVAAAAGAYFFMGAGSGAAGAASGVGATGVNPMVSAV